MSVESVVSNLASQISSAIQKAARSTGISFQYLLTTAQIESGLNPKAQASTSSAKGLYQFIDQTWLATLKQDGPSLGLGQYANAITETADGHYTVADPAMRDAILKLRNDPSTSAMMAGALARNNAAQLQTTTGRAPTEGELYAAHFLGPEGAGKLINAAATDSHANAATMFPAAAAANRNIFYHRNGSAKTVGEVYARLTGKFDNTRVAVASPSAGPPALRPTLTPQMSIVSDTAGITQAYADARTPQAIVPDNRPLFQSMFSDPAQSPVNKTVERLWTPTDRASAAATSIATPESGQSVRSLDLFTDGATNARGIFHGRG